MYRRIALAALLVAGSVHSSRAAADPARCRELIRKYETDKAQLSAVEISLTLFAAANADCINLATALLDGGASVDARDRLGARPLSHAARSGHLDMVDLLLARGAPVDARNLAGSTALYLAAERGHVAIVQRLIDRGADVNLTGRSGASAVAAAAYAGRDMVVRMLLAHGADGRKADDTGKPPVVYAAAGGQLGIVKQLLALEIDINARYANDLTLLIWAAGPDETVPEAQALEVVSYLLDAGARVDERDARGRTALMIAAEGNHPAIAKALLAHGADAALTDKAGKHAADLTILSALREELTPH
ncbi:ankyrin repeat domain-containing protein [Bradyrhizobium quebecense]|uniref:Ankyrin repeat domain-containing protein n=2 Tax=Bradyrhizobium quebecense TaxID=2748629 RepID=A0ACD3VGC1_9BRAD|nr:ankyrin repeat domain-containing protein [Bradyrhizobium quebecense]UGY05187.1 ankyrin repeat domain-containing protein [Bradyrhizobium quebecense]